MKKQINRLSPHQNAKVFGILMAVASLAFVIPMFAIMYFSIPPVDQNGNPVGFFRFMILLFPFLYLIFGYLMTIIGSIIYNQLYKFIGGFEFEVIGKDV